MSSLQRIKALYRRARETAVEDGMTWKFFWGWLLQLIVGSVLLFGFGYWVANL